MMRRSALILLLISAWLWGHAEVREQAVTYMSVDQHGDSIRLSGLLSIPDSARGIILIPHYTIAACDESPSQKATGEAKAFRDNYVLLMPDYIGYGITCERTHPYLHGALTARNTVDMLLGLQPMLDSLSLGISLDSIYIVGYSQGGAAALWTLRLLEEEYADRIHVRQCFAGSAPIDVASIYEMALQTGRADMPALIPLLVAGTCEAYDIDLPLSTFFTPALERCYTRYIATKQYHMLSLYFRMPNHRLSHWLTPAGMDPSTPAASQLYRGLLRSSLVHYPLDGVGDSICPTWTPRSPLYVFHSTRDEIVPFLNAEHLRRCYPDVRTITWDLDRYKGHIGSSRIFFRKVRQMLDNP
jgi:pimeloyl-ACP methyl ester carboxylesterase